MRVIPMRRLGHILSIALITAGILVIADVGITLAYQEPLSSIYSSIKQGEKESQLKKIESDFLTRSDKKQIHRAETTKNPTVRKKKISANVAKLAQRPTDLTDNEPQTLAKRAQGLSAARRCTSRRAIEPPAGGGPPRNPTSTSWSRPSIGCSRE